MTQEEFRDRLWAMEITMTAFAKMVGVHLITVSYWGRARARRGYQPFPPWVPLLLSLMERVRALEAPQEAP